MKKIDVDGIQKAQRKFAKARDWDQYHTVKNLSIALSVEVSELLELQQWKNEKEVKSYLKSKKGHARFSEELSDILYYLVRIADIGEFDLEAGFWKKMKQNEKKYPVNLAKGNAKKWSELTSAKD